MMAGYYSLAVCPQTKSDQDDEKRRGEQRGLGLVTNVIWVGVEMR